jgi:hypothetical protein
VLPVSIEFALTQVLPVSIYASCSVTGQYHKARKESPDFFASRRKRTESKGRITMDQKALQILGIGLALVIAIALGRQPDGFNLLAQQLSLISATGARQWLWLVASTLLLPGTLQIAPSNRGIARLSGFSQPDDSIRRASMKTFIRTPIS